jgi:polyferredoxin
VSLEDHPTPGPSPRGRVERYLWGFFSRSLKGTGNETPHPSGKRNSLDKIARRLVQLGFVGVFLYPFVLVIYTRVTFQTAPTLTSWLLPWDPLLMVGNAAGRNWTVVVWGAPLVLLALSVVFGRFFCGWVCPIGTLLDIVRPLFFWQKGATGVLGHGFRAGGNSRLRYFLLAGVVLAGAFSIQALDWLDPLVIFQRTASGVMTDAFAMQQAPLHAMLSVISLAFLGIVLLEMWQPRYWCRNLCPLGALLGLVSRFSLTRRKVSAACTLCGDCRRVCPMNAIPREAHDTSASDCTLCLECQAACPQHGVSFVFGAQGEQKWQRGERVTRTDGSTAFKGGYTAARPEIKMSRREALSGAAVGLAWLVVSPLAQMAPQAKVLRPPGALPEGEFLCTCIACQECVRVCPSGGLRPAFLEAGLAGIGTPRLVPRQGGCSLNPSCPDLCAQVCPVGALRRVSPKELKLGLAVVDAGRCLAWDQGVKCLVCVEACLAQAAVAYKGRVTVDPQKCTGCGRCESGCPVAGSAIRVKAL